MHQNENGLPDPPPLPCRHCGTPGLPDVFVQEEDPDGFGPPIGSYAKLKCEKCGRFTILGLSASVTKEEIEQLEREAEEQSEELWRLEHEGHKDQSDE